MDLQRGPKYDAYAKLRETKLRFNYLRLQPYQQQQQPQPKIPTPPTKNVKFHVGLPSGRKGSSSSSYSSSLIAQSVPDFSSLLKKENRKPSNTLPTNTATLTPPLKSKNKGYGVLSSSKGKNGSSSANAAEKKKGGGILMARKSYANFDELKSFSSATANAINGESRNSRVFGNRTVLRCREF